MIIVGAHPASSSGSRPASVLPVNTLTPKNRTTSARIAEPASTSEVRESSHGSNTRGPSWPRVFSFFSYQETGRKDAVDPRGMDFALDREGRRASPVRPENPSAHPPGTTAFWSCPPWPSVAESQSGVVHSTCRAMTMNWRLPWQQSPEPTDNWTREPLCAMNRLTANTAQLSPLTRQSSTSSR